MPVTDRREPAVYVTIEDASYAAPAIEIGRTVYAVTVCDRGPHNRVLTFTSKAQFHKLMGKPDYRRTTLAHYLIDKALDYTNKVLVVRAMPEDSTLANAKICIPEDPENQSVAMSTIVSKANNGGEAKFLFEADSKIVSSFDSASYAAIYAYGIGTWIYLKGEAQETSYQIVGFNSSESKFILDRKFSGITSTSDGDSIRKYNPFIVDHSVDINTITDLSDTNPESDEFQTEGYNIADNSVVYQFVAKGTGSYYNKLKVMGTRNVQLEKMYTDEDGNVLYPYLFMDIGIYQMNDDGTKTLMEGPWQVSLTRKISTGSTIKDLSSGSILYIENVINENSLLLECIDGGAVSEKLIATGSITEEQAAKNRLQVMSLLSIEGLTISSDGNISVGNGTQLENGTDGTVNVGAQPLPMYNSSGNLESDREKLNGLIKQAYMGSMTSVDGSIEQLPECTYPWYEPDYIVTGGYPAEVQEGGRYLADYRQDCIHLGDTGGKKVNYSADIAARLDAVPWNVWTSALYVQYRKVYDMYTGERIWMTPVYHALERHLYCDGAYFIAEPVAGIEKGSIQESIQLAYKANHTERGDLMDKELNMVIVEPQGKYILTQFTTWKRLSVLKRLHVAKFVAYIRKVIPTLLKDILQRRATQYWIGQCNSRVSNFLNKFIESNVERYSILKDFNVNVAFDDVRSEINLYVSITPIRAIERINVYIAVH